MYARSVPFRRALAVVGLAACGGSHHHGPAAHPDDTRHLYVEIATAGAHEDALHDGAASGLSALSFAVAVDGGGDVELQVETSTLHASGGRTTCDVKILIFRLPQHDLLGIADGSAYAMGDDAGADCVRGVAATLVRGKVRTLLRRRLDAK